MLGAQLHTGNSTTFNIFAVPYVCVIETVYYMKLNIHKLGQNLVSFDYNTHQRSALNLNLVG